MKQTATQNNDLTFNGFFTLNCFFLDNYNDGQRSPIGAKSAILDHADFSGVSGSTILAPEARTSGQAISKLALGGPERLCAVRREHLLGRRDSFFNGVEGTSQSPIAVVQLAVEIELVLDEINVPDPPPLSVEDDQNSL